MTLYLLGGLLIDRVYKTWSSTWLCIMHMLWTKLCEGPGQSDNCPDLAKIQTFIKKVFKWAFNFKLHYVYKHSGTPLKLIYLIERVSEILLIYIHYFRPDLWIRIENRKNWKKILDSNSNLNCFSIRIETFFLSAEWKSWIRPYKKIW